MPSGAQLNVTDLRRATRHPVDHRLFGEHRQLGDILLHIVNVSAHGFMVRDRLDLGKGERVTVRLPTIGRIEAFVVWNDGDRAGFQFERIIRGDDFVRLIDALQPNPRLRRER